MRAEMGHLVFRYSLGSAEETGAVMRQENDKTANRECEHFRLVRPANAAVAVAAHNERNIRDETVERVYDCASKRSRQLPSCLGIALLDDWRKSSRMTTTVTS